MTAKGSISDTGVIIKARWSLFQHDGSASFPLLGRSPLQPPLSAKDLPGEQTQVFNFSPINRIVSYPVESIEDSPPVSLSDTENSLYWYSDLENSYDSEDDGKADIESDMELHDCMENLDGIELPDVSIAPIVLIWMWPKWMSNNAAQMRLVTVSAFEKGEIWESRKSLAEFVNKFHQLLLVA